MRALHTLMRLAGIVFVCAWFAACAGVVEDVQSQESRSIIGQLESGVVAIGGETTGWQIVRPGLVTGGAIEVDVSAVQRSADRLDRAFVQAFGRIEQRSAPEHGTRAVFVISELRDAP